jgi:hypothetical protein
MLAINTRKQGEDIALKLSENDPIVDSAAEKDYYLKPDADLAQAITFDELLVGLKKDLHAMFQKGKVNV